MKKLILCFIFLGSTSAFATPNKSYGFPECVDWLSRINFSTKATHFLCSRGNPLKVAQCVEGVRQRNAIDLSTYGTLLLCDKGNFSRVQCALTLSGYHSYYITKVCNPHKDQTSEAWDNF